MNLDDIKQSVQKLLSTEERDRKENREKLDSIIDKLTAKKSRLKQKMLEMGEDDHTSDAYAELDQEYQVVSKLLKKARQNYSEVPSESSEP